MSRLILYGIRNNRLFKKMLKKASHTAKYSSLFTGVDAATIQRAAAGLPSNIYNTLAQVAGVTPGITPRVTPGFTHYKALIFIYRF